ncbi:MAG: PAS domain S-box protein [Magnetococcales bacterium]|nr:PAS domain S-box protein [Magnetococcales bacterium]
MNEGGVGEEALTGVQPVINGYALRREDDTLGLANATLHELVRDWGGLERWWLELRAVLTLPAVTQCPECGLAQRLGTVLATVALPASGDREGGRRTFEVAFCGHAHGLADAAAGDVLLVRDLTHRQQREASLRETIRRLEAMGEAIRDVYLALDLDGLVQFASPSLSGLLLYRVDELVGTPFVDLCVDSDYWSEILDLLNRQSRIEEFDLVVRCRKGNQIPVSLGAAFLEDGQGRRLGIEAVLRDVSEREQLDALLAERNGELQAAVAKLEQQRYAMDQHAIVWVTDPGGRVVFASERMVGVTQYSREELKGQELSLLDSGLHPPSFFKEMWRTVQGGRVWRGEVRYRRKDGGFFWVSSTIVPFMSPTGKPYQYVFINSDISHRIQEEARLGENRAFLLDISDSLGAGVLALDMEGCLTFLNKKGEQLLGWREDELLGQNFHSLVHSRKVDGSVRPVEDCPMQRALLGRSVRVEEDSFTRKNGETLMAAYVATPLRRNREIVGSVTVFQDIGKQLRKEAELRSSRDQALENSRLKSEFLANMSHEIRTPMNAIVGMNDLLMDSPLNDEQLEFAKIVRESSLSLLSLINDILDFSKIEAGKVDIEVIDFTLVTVVEGAAELLASQANAKGLSLMTLISPRIPRVLRGDPGRLRQMLLNLIGNAVKFTDAGEVMVRAELASRQQHDLVVHFSVADTGIGLSSSVQSRLFMPFSQGTGDTNRKYGGTGLGLAITKRLVDLMGGEIGAESGEGRGAVFWFRVPFVASEVPADKGADPGKLAAPLKGVRILLVLINISDREILESYLTSWHVIVETVTSGEAARAALREATTRGERYSAIIVGSTVSDLELKEFSQGLDREGLLGGMPVVALQELEDKSWRQEVMLAGCAAVLTKPVRLLELAEKLVGVIAPEKLRPKVASFSEELPSVLPEPDTYDALESGKLLLLVEDNPVNRKVALTQLKKMGYAAHAVANGKEAVEAVGRLPYALILMDCQMPVMDGFEATHAIRRMDQTSSRHIPIIAMTANAMKGDRERCLKAGMDDYLSKPVAPEDLKKKLQYWIPKRMGEVPPIEINQLRQLFGSDDGVIRELLRHFVTSTRELLAELGLSITAEKVARTGEIALELKGACSNMGASSMVQLSRQMEQAMEGPIWEDARHTLSALERVFQRIERFVLQF